MTRYATRDCDCPDVVTGTGQKRPDFCACGNRFQTAAELRSARADAGPQELRDGNLPASPCVGVGSSASRRRSRRSAPRRDWSLAQAKKEEEGCCRICKRSDRPLESAHVLGREHDEPKVGADGRPTKELLVHPDRVFPVCGPFPDGCHGDVDHKRINYLPYLTLAEQIKAVEDAGGIAPAYMRLMPVEHREEREGSSAVELEAVIHA